MLSRNHLRFHKQIIKIEKFNNTIKKPIWQEAEQLAIYKRSQGVAPGTSTNNSNSG